MNQNIKIEIILYYKINKVYKMPRNLRGGKKAKKGSNKNVNAEKNPYIIKKECQEYAKVIKSFGGYPPQISLQCLDGKERIGIVSGRLRKRVFCNKGDIVLVNLRDYQDSKCDIIWKYLEKDIYRLLEENEVPYVFIGQTVANNENKSFNEYDIDDVDSIFSFDNLQEKYIRKEVKETKNKDTYLDDSFLPTDSDEEPPDEEEEY